MDKKSDERPKGYRDTHDPNLAYKGETFDCVVIDGSNLLAGGSELDTVTLAGVEATITAQSATQVNVSAGSSVAKSGDVVITANTGGNPLVVSFLSPEEYVKKGSQHRCFYSIQAVNKNQWNRSELYSM